MSRRARILFPGAVYLVNAITADNRAVFSHQETVRAFETYLHEVVARHHWHLYAYACCRNVLHLLCKTPAADLPAGMKWLMGQTAAHYNRGQKRTGHVFASRYKSILVEEDPVYLLPVIHFIHAAPLRAGLAGLEQLHALDGCSYKHYLRQASSSARNGSLDTGILEALAERTQPHGARRTPYRELFAASREAHPDSRHQVVREYDRGWFIGSEKLKLNYARKLTGINPEPIWTGRDYRDMHEVLWEERVISEMARLGKSEDDVFSDRKGAAWKTDIACILRMETSASNIWIARRLNMGHPNRVSMVLKAARET